MTVEILMAVYNGSAYIEEQINSILNQSFKDWHLTIKDDCSNDNSLEISEKYANKYPEKISVIKSTENSGCAKANFFSLLPTTTADYIMFCDQDDYWLENKIETTLEYMQKNERADTPVLVHSDLTVADKNLDIIHKSMFQAQRLDPTKASPNNIMVQNIVTGCTVMINRPLASLLSYTPTSVPVHDWWIGLVASVFGKIIFINQPTLLYRQHSSNVCGAKNMSDPQYLLTRATDKKATTMLQLGYAMSKEFALVYKDKLDTNTHNMLTEYGNMGSYNKIKKLITICKFGIWKNGLIRKIGQIIYM